MVVLANVRYVLDIRPSFACLVVLTTAAADDPRDVVGSEFIVLVLSFKEHNHDKAAALVTVIGKLIG